MEVTDKMIKAFGNVEPCECHPENEAGTRIQGVLDELFPPPGANPLAHDLAYHRKSMELSLLRQALASIDGAEHRIRERMELERRRSNAGFLGQTDPETDQILTTLVTLRRALTPWAMSGWISMNAEYDTTETEQPMANVQDCRSEHGVGHLDCPKCWRWSERNPNRVTR